MPQSRGADSFSVSMRICAASIARSSALKISKKACSSGFFACAAAAHAKNPELHAFLEIFNADERAIEAAQIRIDTEKESAPLLCGIPLALKDNILLEGKIASAASKMLENYRATYD